MDICHQLQGHVLVAWQGLLRGVADNPMRLGVCSRSGDVIEPMLKPQWYVRCGDVAAQACKEVREGRLEITPKEHTDTWFRSVLPSTPVPHKLLSQL